MLGVGTISTETPEFAYTASELDGAFFNRIIEGEQIHIWQILPGETEARKVSFSDHRYSDLDPHLSPLGDRLYFSSDRPRPGALSDAPEDDMNTWYMALSDKGWGDPIYLGEHVNSLSDEVFVSEDTNGVLYFARFGDGEGRARPTTIMSAKRSGDGFLPAEPILTKPAQFRLSNPAISPDGRWLVAASRRAPELGPDLFIAVRLDDNSWSEFKPIPTPVNTNGSAEFAPGFSSDGYVLFFTSDRTGNREIYQYPVNAILDDMFPTRRR